MSTLTFNSKYNEILCFILTIQILLSDAHIQSCYCSSYLSDTFSNLKLLHSIARLKYQVAELLELRRTLQISVVPLVASLLFTYCCTISGIIVVYLVLYL